MLALSVRVMVRAGVSVRFSARVGGSVRVRVGLFIAARPPGIV